MYLSFLMGLAGEKMTADERDFIADVRPSGVALYARNLKNFEHVRDLTTSIKRTLGNRTPIFVMEDMRELAKHEATCLGYSYPRQRELMSLYEQSMDLGNRATYLLYWLLGAELEAMGINGTYVRLDLHSPEPDGDNGKDIDILIQLAKHAAMGLRHAGVCPMLVMSPDIKFWLGEYGEYGERVITAPRDVLLERDFYAFSDESLAHMPMALIENYIYENLDPNVPAPCSTAVINDLIRRDMNYKGMLLADNIHEIGYGYLTLEQRISNAVYAGVDWVVCGSESLDTAYAVAECFQYNGHAMKRWESVYASVLAQKVEGNENLIAAEILQYGIIL